LLPSKITSTSWPAKQLACFLFPEQIRERASHARLVKLCDKASGLLGRRWNLALKRRMKKAMQALDILGEQEGIDQQALDDYAKLFGQHLSDSHIHALTALFNWSLPDELGPGEGLELVAD
jgi:hypothetical protein